MDKKDSFTISQVEKEIRLDQFLRETYPEFSRNYFQNLIRDGLVRVNNRIAKKRTLVGKDDQVDISFPLPKEISVEPEEIPLQVLFEDDDIIVVNKPAGLVVHPAAGNWTGTFANALLFHLQRDPTSHQRPGIVHRLDKETSGILVAAKTAFAHKELVRLFSERKVKKQYLAIAFQTPKEAIIDAPIGRHPVKRKEMTVRQDGKEAITKLEILASKEELSLLLLQPITGRTHQLRVHLKHIQTPILGDSTYGSERLNRRYKAIRQCLHAWKTSFPHPRSGRELSFTASLPEDMLHFIHGHVSMTDLPLEIS